MHLLRLVAEEKIGDRHRHQHQPDREQHLIERAGAIEPAIERPLERDADERGHDKGDRQRGQKRHAGAVHQQGRDVAAQHRERAVREVDEVHQPQRHREPAAEHEQQHAVSNAVEQDCQHVRLNRIVTPTSILGSLVRASDSWNRCEFDIVELTVDLFRPCARKYSARCREQGDRSTPNRSSLSFGGFIRRRGGPVQKPCPSDRSKVRLSGNPAIFLRS